MLALESDGNRAGTLCGLLPYVPVRFRLHRDASLCPQSADWDSNKRPLSPPRVGDMAGVPTPPWNPSSSGYLSAVVTVRSSRRAHALSDVSMRAPLDPAPPLGASSVRARMRRQRIFPISAVRRQHLAERVKLSASLSEVNAATLTAAGDGGFVVHEIAHVAGVLVRRRVLGQ